MHLVMACNHAWRNSACSFAVNIVPLDILAQTATMCCLIAERWNLSLLLPSNSDDLQNILLMGLNLTFSKKKSLRVHGLNNDEWGEATASLCVLLVNTQVHRIASFHHVFIMYEYRNPVYNPRTKRDMATYEYLYYSYYYYYYYIHSPRMHEPWLKKLCP